ncbi:uncharacterized protein LOC122651066 [Telopea speciosissima]|uniref:uncharacterized protein LOC122651066 n=1 Tax=Telopea speciosissima TaxID=54955 RepID=UPI001CC794C5|nr:uncharacterized protein LOC122651066 [Telopea speciosissima]
MELLLLTTLSTTFSLLLTSCAYSHQTDHQMLSSVEQGNLSLSLSLFDTISYLSLSNINFLWTVHDLGISLTKLPRKLRPVEEPFTLKRCKTEDSKPEANKKEDLSGKMIQHSQVMVNGREGTRQRWIQRKDMWQFFTMDYSHIRRRQPIHNKAMPTRP